LQPRDLLSCGDELRGRDEKVGKRCGEWKGAEEIVEKSPKNAASA